MVGKRLEAKHEQGRRRVQTAPLGDFELVRIRVLFDARIPRGSFHHGNQQDRQSG